MEIDMWSLGCILMELLTGYVLFPGEDELDQLALIIEALGMPPKNLMDQSRRTKNFFNANGQPRYCNIRQSARTGKWELEQGFSRRGKVRGVPGSRSLAKMLDQNHEFFLHFMRGCLEWDPARRMTPGEALKHPWFRRRLPRPAVPTSSTTTNTNTTTSSATSTTSTVTTATENNYPTYRNNNHTLQELWNKFGLEYVANKSITEVLSDRNNMVEKKLREESLEIKGGG